MDGMGSARDNWCLLACLYVFDEEEHQTGDEDICCCAGVDMVLFHGVIPCEELFIEGWRLGLGLECACLCLDVLCCFCAMLPCYVAIWDFGEEG